MKRVAIFGSTGSIGQQTLEVVRQFPERFQVLALAAGNNLERLLSQAKEFRPKMIVIGQPDLQPELRERLADPSIQVLAGMEGLMTVATLPEVDVVLTAVVGSIGIRPTLAAIAAGKQIALANKETLVAAGALVMKAAQANGVKVYPVDSEHSAIFQCLEGRAPDQAQRLILTASGGPFRNLQPEELAHVSLEQALNHPNWSMGGKITIDSATMFNKGLEIIEAHWLFGMAYDRIDVVIHPESIVHSLVELVDGSVIAQLGLCDMKLPIQLALTYPDRFSNPFPKLDLLKGSQLNFYPVNPRLFPAVDLAYAAGRSGGTMPTVLNAANEIAVAAFQQKRIGFTDIIRIVSETMGYHQQEEFVQEPNLDEIFAVDCWARQTARRIIERGR